MNFQSIELSELNSTDSESSQHIVDIYPESSEYMKPEMTYSKMEYTISENQSRPFVNEGSQKESVCFDSELCYEDLYDNSPVISNHGSRSNSDDENGSFQDVNSDIEFENQNIVYIRPKPQSRFKKLSSKDIERSLDKYYHFEIDNKYSTEIDILTTYVRGQKNLYIQSKRFTQMKLNFLMYFSLILTTLISVLTPFYCTFELSSHFISGMNALATLIIGLINYLKLESAIEKYLQISNEYDKLESSLDICNNKLLFLKKDEEKSNMVMKKIHQFDAKVRDIKTSNTVLIPSAVKLIFPVICHINIMTFIKKTENYKKDLIKKLKDIKNEIRFILYKWDQENSIGGSYKNTVENRFDLSQNVLLNWGVDPENGVDSPDTFSHGCIDKGNNYHALCEGAKRLNENNQFIRIKEKNRLHYLYTTKNTIRDEILNFRSTYSFLDDLFMKEIKDAETNNRMMSFLFCGKTPTISKAHLKDANPVIIKHFYSIGLISEL